MATIRVTAIYRDQWGAGLTGEKVPATSYPGASADFRTDKGLAKGDAFGVGIYYTDYPIVATLPTNLTGLSLAYHKTLNKKQNQFISLGFDAGIFEGLFDIYADNHYTQRLPLPNGAYRISNDLLFWNLGLGLLYTGQFGKKSGASAYLGFAVDHLNTPVISFLGDNNVLLPIKYTVHGGYNAPLSKHFVLEPRGVFLRQGSANELDLGSDLCYLINAAEHHHIHVKIGAQLRMTGGEQDFASVWYGGIWHNGKLNPAAAIVDAGFEVFGFSFSAAYSIGAESPNSTGAFELAAAYKGAFHRHRQPSFSPDF